MYIKGFCKNTAQEDKTDGICHLELRRKAERWVMVWDFKEEKGSSHGDRKTSA